jgi:CheY-like chemotaxis protein
MVPELQLGREFRHVVLLVEDEVLIRSMAAEVLRDAGFEVIEAGDADEAWAYLVTGAAVDLVLTDIRMPGSMDGLELANRIKEKFDKIHVIVTSSDVIDPSEIPHPFVRKPYILYSILRMISETLKVN